MRWMLLVVGIAMHSIAMGQSTLKIYVANDDARSDMDIIDLNTSALDRYGQSVDSTNINYYATTMSTQVLRVSRIDLFGPEEEIEEELDNSPITASLDISVDFLEPRSNSVSGTDSQLSAQNTPVRRLILERNSNNKQIKSTSRDTSTKPTKRKSNQGKLKKSRKIKRYRGQCPKFF